MALKFIELNLKKVFLNSEMIRYGDCNGWLCECWNPSDVFEEVTRKYFKPQSEFVAGIIGKIVNKSINAKSVQFAEISMLGLVESFGLYRNYTDAVAPGLSEHGIKNDWLAKKITLISSLLVIVSCNIFFPSGVVNLAETFKTINLVRIFIQKNFLIVL